MTYKHSASCGLLIEAVDRISLERKVRTHYQKCKKCKAKA